MDHHALVSIATHHKILLKNTVLLLQLKLSQVIRIGSYWAGSDGECLWVKSVHDCEKKRIDVMVQTFIIISLAEYSPECIKSAVLDLSRNRFSATVFEH